MSNLLIVLAVLVIPVVIGLAVRKFLKALFLSAFLIVAWIFFVDHFIAEPDAMSAVNVWPIALPIASIFSLLWSAAAIWALRRIKT
jgi:hypothetical protein